LHGGHDIVVACDFGILEGQVGIVTQAAAIFLNIDVAFLAAEVLRVNTDARQGAIAAQLLLLHRVHRELKLAFFLLGLLSLEGALSLARLLRLNVELALATGSQGGACLVSVTARLCSLLTRGVLSPHHLTRDNPLHTRHTHG